MSFEVEFPGARAKGFSISPSQQQLPCLQLVLEGPESFISTSISTKEVVIQEGSPLPAPPHKDYCRASLWPQAKLLGVRLPD